MCNITATFTQVINNDGGKCQHRDDQKSIWKSSKVGDVLREGATVRVNLKGGAILRLEKTCGCDTKKGTVTIRPGSMYVIPSDVPEKDETITTPSTTVGRADFKIDKVGLSNDFKVITPSTILGIAG